MDSTRDPVVIAHMAATLYAGLLPDYDYSMDTAIQEAQELWDRAHGTYVEPPDEKEEDEDDEPEDTPGPKKVPDGPSIKLSSLSYVMALGFLAVMLCGFLAWRAQHKKLEASKLALQCGIIHEPATGCPSGYTREDFPAFVESDGSFEFACIDRTKPLCTDVLKPGESEQFTFGLPGMAPQHNQGYQSDQSDPVQPDPTKAHRKL